MYIKIWYGLQLNQISPFTIFELCSWFPSFSTLMIIVNSGNLANLVNWWILWIGEFGELVNSVRLTSEDESSDDLEQRNILPPTTFCQENMAAATISHKLKTAKSSKWNQSRKMRVMMKFNQICFSFQKEEKYWYKDEDWQQKEETKK